MQKYIEQRGLTQAEAAAKLDIDVRTVRRWVAGDAPVPRMADYAMRHLDGIESP